MAEEVKAKIAASQRGRHHSDETKAKIRAAALGKKRSPEAIERIRQAALNRSPEHREKLRQAKRGWHHPPESRAKISAAHRGRKLDPERVARQAQSALGKNATPLGERFWAKVDKSGDCWLWTRTVKNSGYGLAYYGMGGPRKLIYRTAHRIAWELTHGPIPSGQHVLHRCDNKVCVNPAHLFLGSQADNMRDMAAKGRQWKQVRESR